MTYQQTIQWLYSQLPMYQRVGAVAFKKDLSNITRLCDALGNPQNKFKSIHIAGTNGKGSVAHITAAILQGNGYKVGLYTSPHYRDFRERIKINGEYIAEENVVQFVEEQKLLFEEVKPSFFEMTVAMAFEYFKKEKVDFAIIETGLGGRLDSTNVIEPILSVITNIGYDHQQFLGETLPEIAVEKAGIIKKDIPVIIGEEQKEIKDVFLRKAEQENAPVSWAKDIVELTNTISTARQLSFDANFTTGESIKDIHTDLLGSYQEKNLRTALAIVNWLYQQEIIDINSLSTILTNVRKQTNFIGRWMVLEESPLTIADSAHNLEGLQEVFESTAKIDYQGLHIVLGMVSDKEHEKYFRNFPKEATYYFCKPDIPRGLDAESLKRKASSFQLKGKTYPSVKLAYFEAQNAAKANDLVLVLGSIFVVAEVI